MSNFVIITDSSCDLSKDLRNEYNSLVESCKQEVEAAKNKTVTKTVTKTKKVPKESTTANYETNLRNALQDIIDQTGYTNAHIQTEEAYIANLSRVKAYIQKKLFLSEKASEAAIIAGSKACILILLGLEAKLAPALISSS